MISEYLSLVFDGRIQDAEKLRLSSIPSTLYKYVSLNGEPLDDNKMQSLAGDKLWFSGIKDMNDPYENKGIVLDREFFCIKRNILTI